MIDDSFELDHQETDGFVGVVGVGVPVLLTCQHHNSTEPSVTAHDEASFDLGET